MQIKIKNKDLEILHTGIYSLNIPTMKANRGRVKFLKKLEEKYSDFIEFKKTIFDEHLVKENGEFVVDNNEYVIKDGKKEQFNNDITELLNEEVVITGGEYSNRFTDFFVALQNYEGNIEVQYISVIDDILDQFEKQQEDK